MAAVAGISSPERKDSCTGNSIFLGTGCKLVTFWSIVVGVVGEAAVLPCVGCEVKMKHLDTLLGDSFVCGEGHKAIRPVCVVVI